MNTDTIFEAARAILVGTISLPEVVKKLIHTGVEYYHADYINMKKPFYSAAGDIVVVPITYEGMPTVAPNFDSAGLRAAVLDSQRHGQKFRDFTKLAMPAGVQGYFAFLRGQRVTYLGRGGDQHTQWFPGARPAGSQTAP